MTKSKFGQRASRTERDLVHSSRAWTSQKILPRYRISPVVGFAALYILALAVNVAFGLAHGYRSDPLQLDSDEQEYYQLALGLYHHSLILDPRRTLAFPAFIALGFAVFGESVFWAHVLVSVIFSFSAPLVFLIVRRLVKSEAPALLSGLIFLLWPTLVYYGVSLYSESVALPCFLLSLFLLPIGSRADASNGKLNGASAVAAGVSLALSAQVRPMYLLFVPFAILITFLEEEKIKLAGLRSFTLFIAFFVTTLPWSAYMTETFETPILISTNGGETLAGGINPKLLEISPTAPVEMPGGRLTWTGPGKWVNPPLTGYLSEDEQKLPSERLDPILRERTIRWATANPSDAIYLETRKLLYMWGIYPFWNGPFQTVFGNVPTILLWVIALVALARTKRSRLTLCRLWLLPLFVSCVALISWGSWRFRGPGDVGLLILVVVYLTDIMSAGSTKGALVRAGPQNRM